MVSPGSVRWGEAGFGEARLKMTYDTKLGDIPGILRDLLEDAGRRIGLEDFRPEKGGRYGKFEVTEYEVEEDERYVKIKARIRGLTPLLMCRPIRTASKSREYDPEREARESAYIAEIDGKEQLYIPAKHIYWMIMDSAKNYKYKKGRLRLSQVLAGAIRIEPEKIPLEHCDYEVHLGTVAIRLGGVTRRVKRARPMVPEWEASFNIIINKNMLPDNIGKTMKTLLIDAGTTESP